jgi:oxygen-independent coproporphyrinogen III oxidase
VSARPDAARGAGARAGGAFSGPVRHVYVHVPFCRARCDYCDFASTAVGVPGTPGQDARLDAFVDGVAAEWERERAAHDVRRLETLYLGGGTPSLLGPDRLERLLELFRPRLTPHAEVTVEANPEDVDAGFAAWAAAWGTAGPGGVARPAAGAQGRVRVSRDGVRVSQGRLRVSLGVQSFDPVLRRALGRRAQADPAEALLRLRETGVPSLSVDLIHGIPGQTAADVDADVAAVVRLRPGHVSWYELTPAAGTPLAARLAAGLAAADADEDAARYRHIVRALGRAGYDWYEVSNYALPGHKARHNLAYWRARPYLGLGPGAVSTVGARRWTDDPDPVAWASALAAGREPPRAVERLDADVRARERLLLAARCGDPVPLPEVSPVLDPRAVAQLAAAGLVSLHSGRIRVTRKGRYVAGEACVRLFRD